MNRRRPIRSARHAGVVVRVLLLGLAVLVVTSGAQADAIALRRCAAVQDASAVRLGEVAELRGERVAAMSDLVVATNISPSLVERGDATIDLDIVRRALRDAGVALGRVTLSGGVCTLRRADAGTRDPGPSNPAQQEREPQAIDLSGPPTVRRRIIERTLGLLDVESDDLRIAFDDRDSAFLELGEWGRRILVEPATSANASRLHFRVRIFEGDQQLDSQLVSADVLVRRRIVILTQDVERRDPIPGELVRTETRWIAPGGPNLVGEAGVASGQIARTKLVAGEPLRETDLEPPILVKRGELVSVYCMQGTLMIKTEARSLADGCKGDVIELRKEVSRETFVGRVDGRGAVVIDESLRGTARTQ